MRPSYARLCAPAAIGTLLATLTGCSVLRFGHGSDYSVSPFFKTPPAVWSTARTLRVVTFNIKDMYWLSSYRAERMTAVAEALVEAEPDIVCLQEGYVGGDVAVIRDALRKIGVKYVVDYPSGVVGSGMWTLSRFPIRETLFLRFSKNGALLDTEGGDWWTGKGVGLARLEVAPGELLDVYNTHMICNLGSEELRAHRRLQVREYTSFATSATPPNVPALLLGDFNCGYGSADFDHLHYVMRWKPMLKRRWGYDHVFARSPGGNYRFTPLSELAIDRQVSIATEPGHEVPLSDHTCLLAEFRIEPPLPSLPLSEQQQR